MSTRQFAKVLGKRGGRKRAKNLSPERRKAIALLGAKARFESLKLAARIEENFRYVEAIQQFKTPTQISTVRTVRHRLPGIYDKTF